MDKLDERLKRDADAIDAGVPAALRKRLDAQLTGTPRQAHGERVAPRPLWLGLAAAAGLAAVMWLVPANRQAPEPQETFATTPAYVAARPSPLALRVQPVELVEPLEVELQSLRTDLEKVRSSIEEELRSTL